MQKSLLLLAVAGFAAAVTATWLSSYYQAGAVGYRLARARSVTAAIEAARDLLSARRPGADAGVRDYARRSSLAGYDPQRRYLVVQDPADGVCYLVRRAALPGGLAPNTDPRLLATYVAGQPVEIVPVRLGEPPVRFAEIRLFSSDSSESWFVLRPRTPGDPYGVVHCTWQHSALQAEKAFLPNDTEMQKLRARKTWPRHWR